MSLELKGMPGREKQKRQAEDQPSQSPSFEEKRREPRYPTSDLVEICVLQQGNPRLGGTVLDVSRSGLRVEVAIPVSKGARLEILVPNRVIILGEARYCRRISDLYHVGVAIGEVYYAQSFSETHITDDRLAHYLDRKGPSAPEAIQVKNHLVACKSCRDRLPKVSLRRRSFFKVETERPCIVEPRK
jgi:hypothetical protein